MFVWASGQWSPTVFILVEEKYLGEIHLIYLIIFSYKAPICLILGEESSTCTSYYSAFDYVASSFPVTKPLMPKYQAFLMHIAFVIVQHHVNQMSLSEFVFTLLTFSIINIC